MRINSVQSDAFVLLSSKHSKFKHSEISFEGRNNKKKHKEKTYNSTDVNNAFKNGLGTGVIGALAVTLLGIMFQVGYSQDETKRKMHSFLNLVNSKNVRKDTFMLKDITKDSIPEIVLYTKDGKNIVYDVAERQVYREVIVDRSLPIEPSKQSSRKKRP